VLALADGCWSLVRELILHVSVGSWSTTLASDPVFVEFKSEMRMRGNLSKAIQTFELQQPSVGAAVESCRATEMSGLTETRLESRRSTPAASAVTPDGEHTKNIDNLEIDDADIQLLVDFFLQLKKWDKLQSTRTLSEVPESVEDIAA
jgi:hypothetical protein